MLITAEEVITLAYITKLDVNLIKDHIIDAVEHTYIKPVLTELLYNDVVTFPSNYTDLIGKFIKPCLAFYVKYHIYTQQLFETAEYSSPDPVKASRFIPLSDAVLIENSIHNNIIRDILKIAQQKEQILKDYLNASHYELYEKPTTYSISGILIKS